MYLNVEEPGSEIINSFLSLLHAPDDQIESVAREEALVGGVVHLLTRQVPRREHYVHLMLGGGGIINNCTTTGGFMVQITTFAQNVSG